MSSCEHHIATLDIFIRSNPDSRELLRALAVKFALLGYDYQWISTALVVSDSFISKWKIIFEDQGVQGLLLAHKGRQALLTTDQEKKVVLWIQNQSTCTLLQLKNYIQEAYQVVYQSDKSYYALFHMANYNWKKTQHYHPGAKSEAIIAKKKEIHDYLNQHADAIARGDHIVYIWDECHLVWGDICGYIWGSTKKRLSIPIASERTRQTYYGAIDYATRELTIRAYAKGDSEATIHFLHYLRAQHPGKQITIIWDGAPYHTSAAIRACLEEINRDIPEHTRPIQLIQFAPYAPFQNPIESMWLKGKQFLRTIASQTQTFADVKRKFVEYLNKKICLFPENCSLA